MYIVVHDWADGSTSTVMPVVFASAREARAHAEAYKQIWVNARDDGEETTHHKFIVAHLPNGFSYHE